MTEFRNSFECNQAEIICSKIIINRWVKLCTNTKKGILLKYKINVKQKYNTKFKKPKKIIFVLQTKGKWKIINCMCNCRLKVSRSMSQYHFIYFLSDGNS